MSKCSKKCNEIKEKIDSISGLDDNTVYIWLCRLECLTDEIIKEIDKYTNKDKLNGTCFKGLMEEENKEIDKLDRDEIIDSAGQPVYDKKKKQWRVVSGCMYNCSGSFVQFRDDNNSWVNINDVELYFEEVD